MQQDAGRALAAPEVMQAHAVERDEMPAWRMLARGAAGAAMDEHRLAGGDAAGANSSSRRSPDLRCRRFCGRAALERTYRARSLARFRPLGDRFGRRLVRAPATRKPGSVVLPERALLRGSCSTRWAAAACAAASAGRGVR